VEKEPLDPAVAKRLAEVQKADCDAWIQRARDKAIAALGEKPFGYDEDQVGKRKLLAASQGAVIAGLPGRGKTMSMAWVIDRVLKEEAPKYYRSNEMPFLFISASSLWDMFHAAAPPSPTVTWLFLDDWAMEYREPFALTRADEWFRIRESTLGLHTWMTTNLSMDQFAAQPGLDRVVSRIQGMTDWIEVIGRDRRTGWLTSKK
jgi:DNA replication protein DnaC